MSTRSRRSLLLVATAICVVLPVAASTVGLPGHGELAIHGVRISGGPVEGALAIPTTIRIQQWGREVSSVRLRPGETERLRVRPGFYELVVVTVDGCRDRVSVRWNHTTNVDLRCGVK
jgi:hypothetical protein